MHLPHMTVVNLFSVHMQVRWFDAELKAQESREPSCLFWCKVKSSITPSDRGRNGVHVAKIPWSLSAAPLGRGNRYRNDNIRLIVRPFHLKDLNDFWPSFHGEKGLFHVPFYTVVVSSLDECYNWRLNYSTVHYSYSAVGIFERLFEGETYSLWTSDELGVMPQEQLENSIFCWPSTGGRTSNVW